MGDSSKGSDYFEGRMVVNRLVEMFGSCTSCVLWQQLLQQLLLGWSLRLGTAQRDTRHPHTRNTRPHTHHANTHAHTHKLLSSSVSYTRTHWIPCR